jgi:hypothetical protein
MSIMLLNCNPELLSQNLFRFIINFIELVVSSKSKLEITTQA